MQFFMWSAQFSGLHFLYLTPVLYSSFYPFLSLRNHVRQLGGTVGTAMDLEIRRPTAVQILPQTLTTSVSPSLNLCMPHFICKRG